MHARYSAYYVQQASGSGTLKTISDTGTGADAVAGISVALALTDTGAGDDTVANIAAALAVADAAAGADSIADVQAVLQITDSGSGADLGTGDDAHSIAVTRSLTDTASGLDAVLAGALIALADSGLGDDALGITVQAAVLDSGTGTDVIAAGNVALQIIDAAGGTDAVVVFDTQTRIAQIRFSLHGRTMTLTLKGRKAKFTLH